MRVLLANPRGFCAGVNMAIESLEKALELFGAPLYVYHEIVHNRYVVERFRALGVKFIESISEASTLTEPVNKAATSLPAISSRAVPTEA